MEEKQKSTATLIWTRLWTRDLWVSVYFLISLVIIICEHIDKWGFLNLVETIVSYLDEGTMLYTLAISYVSGSIVYFFTVVLPEIRKSKPILVEIEKTLKYLIDEFYEIANFDKDDCVNTLVGTVKEYGKFNDNHYSLYFMSETLNKIYQSIEKLTSSVLTLSSALAKNEIDTLVDIRNRKITQQLKDKDGVESLIRENELYRYFEEMEKLYVDIATLRKQISNRIYKQ